MNDNSKLAISRAISPGLAAYCGIFAFALCTLAFQILITRLFSVTVVYHFAFAGISLAMLGLTAGALIVYLFPARFPMERLSRTLSVLAILFACGMLASVFFHMTSPASIRPEFKTYVILALHFSTFFVPFTLSGVAIALLLTRYSSHVSRMYAADLCGAAVGCIAVLVLLSYMHLVSALLFLTIIMCFAAFLFAREDCGSLTQIVAWNVLVLAVAGFSYHFYCEQNGLNHLRLTWAKGHTQGLLAHESWNTYSRVAVSLPGVTKPQGWGIPPEKTAAHPLHEQMWMNIDSAAGTMIYAFDGDRSKLKFLGDDAVNVAYHVRPPRRVAVIGVGGGRDILTALYFQAETIAGIEINDDILRILREVFDDFTGDLESYPEVTFYNAEARSFLAQQQDAFDLIQISLIDTWAATAAGAFALSEHALYTVEGFNTFLDALSDKGILSISRWHSDSYSNELHRMLALSSETFKGRGVQDASKHIMVIGGGSTATLLLSKEPFSEAEVMHARAVAKRQLFRTYYMPNESEDPLMIKLASGSVDKSFFRDSANDISPVTDDRPYFFHMVRFADVFSNKPKHMEQQENFAVKVLVTLAILMSAIALLFVVVPLLLTARRHSLSGSLPGLLYFCGIGFGFMFIEIAQMSRLMIFLGHPVYGLAVVLFSLLLFSGLGSLSTGNLENISRRFYVLVGILVFFGLFTNSIIDPFRASPDSVRIVVSVITLAPLGYVMGMCFPIGIKMTEDRFPAILPWFWAINGLASVLATIFATVASMSWGISFTYWLGAASYLLCLSALPLMRRAEHA